MHRSSYRRDSCAGPWHCHLRWVFRWVFRDSHGYFFSTCSWMQRGKWLTARVSLNTMSSQIQWKLCLCRYSASQNYRTDPCNGGVLNSCCTPKRDAFRVPSPQEVLHFSKTINTTQSGCKSDHLWRSLSYFTSKKTHAHLRSEKKNRNPWPPMTQWPRMAGGLLLPSMEAPVLRRQCWRHGFEGGHHHRAELGAEDVLVPQRGVLDIHLEGQKAGDSWVFLWWKKSWVIHKLPRFENKGVDDMFFGGTIGGKSWWNKLPTCF